MIDAWCADNLEPGYTHVVGFAYEEEDRAVRDTKARREKQERGEVVECTPSYPLRLWRWNRERCSTFLTAVFTLDAPWPRSCCTFCPFSATAGSRPELVARWREQPSAGADALELEWTAMAVNPMIGAFGVRDTAHDVARENGLDRALAIARHRIKSRRDWVLVEVRRVFTAKDNDPDLKGFAWRSIEVVQSGSHKQMLAALRAMPDIEVEIDQYGITRSWRVRRPGPDQPARYPMREWLFVAVPSGVVHAKKRPGFDAVWNADTLF